MGELQLFRKVRRLSPIQRVLSPSICSEDVLLETDTLHLNQRQRSLLFPDVDPAIPSNTASDPIHLTEHFNVSCCRYITRKSKVQNGRSQLMGACTLTDIRTLKTQERSGTGKDPCILLEGSVACRTSVKFPTQRCLVGDGGNREVVLSVVL